VWAERGPVAETEVGTVGKGRGGTSLFMRGRRGREGAGVSRAALASVADCFSLLGGRSGLVE
jgi:hypothetical protein